MVVTVIWFQSWVSLVLTLATLLIVVCLIIFCTCFDERKKRSNAFYVIDENGFKKENLTSPSNLHVFRRLSTTTEPENVFTSKNLPLYSCGNERRQTDELVDSMEITKSFDSVVLKFDEYDAPMIPRDKFRSCLSAESLNSFYSAHPSTIARGTSRESFVSLISEFDNDI